MNASGFEYPSVSVVIPAFNEERYIVDAVLSAQRQTCPPYEVLVVDDGSSDRTGALAAAAGARVIRQERGGVSSARNLGVSQAQGDWVAFLDADDAWDDRKLEFQLEALRAFPTCEFIANDFMRFQGGALKNEAWITSRKVYCDVVGPRVHDESVFLTADEIAQCLTIENFIPTSSVLVKRRLILDVGGFDESMSHCEDHDCWMRLLRATGAVVIHKSLVRYHMHEGSASSRWEKILEGDVRLARRILEVEGAYHENTVTLAKTLLPDHLSTLGRHYVRVGNAEAATWPLLESFRLAPRAKTMAWLTLGYMLRLSFIRKIFLIMKARKNANSLEVMLTPVHKKANV